jgi:phosphoesterase RecJ-like protein
VAPFSSAPEWDKAVSAIAESSSVLLLAHVTPDADALGSALGLGLALESMGKQVQVTVGETGFTTPASLSFLPGTELIRTPEDLSPVGLVISCDVHQMRAFRQTTLEAAPFQLRSITIFTGFGTIHLVDPNAAGCCEIILG